MLQLGIFVCYPNMLSPTHLALCDYQSGFTSMRYPMDAVWHDCKGGHSDVSNTKLRLGNRIRRGRLPCYNIRVQHVSFKSLAINMFVLEWQPIQIVLGQTFYIIWHFQRNETSNNYCIPLNTTAMWSHVTLWHHKAGIHGGISLTLLHNNALLIQCSTAWVTQCS